MSDANVRTRFAPSPTGHLHVGGARTALFCWAYARGHDGRFIVRIEDTDQARSSGESTQAILRDLAWLGIGWDEGPAYGEHGCGEGGPWLQSQRVDLHRDSVDRLIAEGHAYRAFETAEELDASRAAARSEGRTWRYDRAALELDAETIEQRVSEGIPHVVRFKVPDGGAVSVRDEVLGEVSVDASEIDDFVIWKADGSPTYHLAVVVDDQDMGVTHVIRGQEHLNNTARHALLQDALGYDRPCYAHLSLIFNPDGSKMSKRDKDKALRVAIKERAIDAPPAGTLDADAWNTWRSAKDAQLPPVEAAAMAAAIGVELPEIDVEDFKAAGYLPEVLINYLGLLGWSPGDDREHFDAAFLAEHFSLDRIVKSPAKFDRKKLLAFNLDAIQAMDSPAFEAALRTWCEDYAPAFLDLRDRFTRFAAANHQRSKTLADPAATCGFLLQADDAIIWEETKPMRKALLKGEPTGLAVLADVAAALEAIDDWSEDALGTCLEAAAPEGKLGRVAQPLRAAVSGGPISPPIFDTLILLGREATLARVSRCLAHFASHADA